MGKMDYIHVHLQVTLQVLISILLFRMTLFIRELGSCKQNKSPPRFVYSVTAQLLKRFQHCWALRTFPQALINSLQGSLFVVSCRERDWLPEDHLACPWLTGPPWFHLSWPQGVCGEDQGTTDFCWTSETLIITGKIFKKRVTGITVGWEGNAGIW